MEIDRLTLLIIRTNREVYRPGQRVVPPSVVSMKPPINLEISWRTAEAADPGRTLRRPRNPSRAKLPVRQRI